MENRFKSGEISERIYNNYNKVIKLLTDNDITDYRNKLISDMKNIQDEEKIKIAFIGQYTAGKSSIISALTGNKGIKIGSNITTEETTNYEWGGFYLTDTPGLYTERKEHDEITIECIKKADLLVFCITSDLFNPCTLSNFIKLAFEQNYKNKILFVINKMSKEAGEYEQLKENYEITLNKSLSPYTLDSFDVAYIDVKDYVDGINECNNNLIEYSHFNEFKEMLNNFITRKGQLAKLTTPAELIIHSIDDILETQYNNDSRNNGIAILNRLQRKIIYNRNKTKRECEQILNNGILEFNINVNQILNSIGTEDIEKYDEIYINNMIEKIYNSITSSLEDVIYNSQEYLDDEIKDFFNSEIVVYYIENGSKLNNSKLNFSKISKAEHNLYNEIKKMTKGGADTIIQKTFTKGTSKFFGTASEASGSFIHQGVKFVGHKFGYKFKPWQAVNISKNIGNVAKCLGPIISFIDVGVTIKDTLADSKREQEILREKENLKNEFNKIINQIEEEFIEQIQDFINCTFNKMIDNINNESNKVNRELAKKNTMVSELIDIKKELIDLKNQIDMHAIL
ncbi:GTP-binding protein [Romboutsia ilealis]|uniref:GTP-binding protein n=1 Tax=Romboutsia ilealis TaxID=1115758 RepID=A0A1V1I1C7_9FIRM|nr:LeoA/HP0731 family dynamin-like GTPase [Romboutsia ilealis]CED94041.1 GTP-binding protein [Romboutsia ilealis]